MEVALASSLAKVAWVGFSFEDGLRSHVWEMSDVEERHAWEERRAWGMGGAECCGQRSVEVRTWQEIQEWELSMAPQWRKQHWSLQ